MARDDEYTSNKKKMAAAARAVTGGSSALPAALLVALLACAAARVAVVGGASSCDGVDCGMGSCVSELLVTHRCVCDPGWAQYTSIVPFFPCTIPNCSTGDSCLNITLPSFNVTLPDPTQPDFSVCKFVDICGPLGTCVKGKSIVDFQCQCNPGAVNMIKNVTASPCIRNCVIGKDGCPVPPPPPSPPPPSPPSSPAPPPGNHDSSGSVSWLQNLLPLVLASLAAVQIM